MRLRGLLSRALVATALMLLVVGGLTACGDVEDSSGGTVATEAVSSSVSSVVTTLTTILPTTCTTTAAPATSTTTTAPAATASPVMDISGSIPTPPAEVFVVDMSSVALLMEERASVGRGGLYAYVFATEKMVQLPVDEGMYVDGMDIDGDLVVWAERQYSDGPDPTSSTYAFRLPDGPKVKVADGGGGPKVDDGRIFWTEWTRVSGEIDEGEEVLSTCVIQMVEVDENGHPEGSPVEVTDQPNSSHEAGGDELWSYDVEGSYLTYQRMYGTRPGVYLADLRKRGGDGSDDIYLGVGSVPSMSGSLVVWRGEPEDGLWQVWGYSLKTGVVAIIAQDGHMPFAGPDYVVYARHREDSSGSDLYLLDEKTGAVTLLGMTTAGVGWPFISIAGNTACVAWVTRNTTTSGDVSGEQYEVRLVAIPDSLGVGQPVRDIWDRAQNPPMWGE